MCFLCCAGSAPCDELITLFRRVPSSMRAYVFVCDQRPEQLGGLNVIWPFVLRKYTNVNTLYIYIYIYIYRWFMQCCVYYVVSSGVMEIHNFV
jgi:hypothetical protein